MKVTLCMFKLYSVIKYVGVIYLFVTVLTNFIHIDVWYV